MAGPEYADDNRDAQPRPAVCLLWLSVFDHDPICVHDCTDDCGSPTYYCNHGYPSAHIDEAGLATGTTCEWPPES